MSGTTFVDMNFTASGRSFMSFSKLGMSLPIFGMSFGLGILNVPSLAPSP